MLLSVQESVLSFLKEQKIGLKIVLLPFFTRENSFCRKVSKFIVSSLDFLTIINIKVYKVWCFCWNMKANSFSIFSAFWWKFSIPIRFAENLENHDNPEQHFSFCFRLICESATNKFPFLLLSIFSVRSHNVESSGKKFQRYVRWLSPHQPHNFL